MGYFSFIQSVSVTSVNPVDKEEINEQHWLFEGPLKSWINRKTGCSVSVYHGAVATKGKLGWAEMTGRLVIFHAVSVSGDDRHKHHGIHKKWKKVSLINKRHEKRPLSWERYSTFTKFTKNHCSQSDENSVNNTNTNNNNKCTCLFVSAAKIH